MGWQEVAYQREELYRLVWDKPVREIARSIGISDVALAKACRNLGIPLPGRGYWARKATGEHMIPPPLPAANQGQTRYVIRRWVDPGGTPSKPPIAPSPDEITVPETLRQPHELIQISLPLLRQAKESRVNLLSRERCLDVSASTREVLDRAIRIMDTLIKALEGRGFTVKVLPPGSGKPDYYGRQEPEPSKTMACMDGTDVRFGLREAYDRVETPVKRAKKIFETYTPRPEHEYRPNGRLALEIYSYHHRPFRKTWADAKRQRVERCLGRFVQTLLEIVASERQKRSEDKARRLAAEEAERQRAERERIRAIDTARLKDLDERLQQWEKARAVRNLADRIEEDVRRRGEATDKPGGVGEWLAWARGLASGLEERALRNVGMCVLEE
jgi:hypothetical protein